MRKAASQESTSQDFERDEPPRDSHGRRGLQPPPTFDFDQLGNGTFLSEFETAAVLRVSSNTLAAWRQRPAHGLRWLTLPNGFIRYRVGDLRAYLASGKPRKRGQPRKKGAAAAAAPPKRKPGPGTSTATTKISKNATPSRRRAPRRAPADSAVSADPV